MDKTNVINLTGHAQPYRLDEAAYDRLSRYLDRAASRLQADPDRAEVLGDLERSVGDKLTALLGSEDHLVTETDIEGILEEIGVVDTGHEPGPEEPDPRPSGRRLQRIREGQSVAGVCTGLAAYADVDVSWVRTAFVLGTLVTAGILGVVYLAMAFILPIAATREAADTRARLPARHLQRVREGQRIAGVCTGLAAYAELPVDWVRTLFVLAALLTAGLFVVVYIALALILPVPPRRKP